MTIATTASSLPSFTQRPRPLGATILMYAALVVTVGVLGFAAFMKMQAGGGLNITVAIAEFAFLASLVAFRTRWAAWAGATMLFAMFAGFTGYLLWRGETSCGCFGKLETAPANTIKLDIGMTILAAGVTIALARRAAVIGLLATLGGVASVFGAGMSVLMAPPLASDFHGDRAGLLLASPELTDIASADLAAPDWLVYLYDPAAKENPRLGAMLDYQHKHADDEILRVRVMTTAEALAASTVPAWAWEKLPQTILYRNGQVVMRAMADEIEEPTKTRQARPTGPISQVLALPEYAEILYSHDQWPIRFLYVYNPDCPLCLEHLAVLETFQEEYPDDPNVAITPISMHDLRERLGIEIWQWPGVPTTFIMQAGRVIAQTAGPNGVPNPYQIRMDLSVGKPLQLPGVVTDEHAGHDHD